MYARMDQEGIRNSVSFNKLTTVAKEAMPNLDDTTDSRAYASIEPAKETLAEEEKYSYAAEKSLGQENRPTETHYNVCWFAYGPQGDSAEPADRIPHYFQ